MKRMTYLAIAMLSVINATVGAVSTAANGLEVLNDQELSAETGQALFNLAYTAPNDSANLMTGKTIAGAAVGNVGFYKLGMEAEIELNANIKKLQLGCGGVNGAGGCDVEINNLAISGLPNSYDSTTGAPIYSSTGGRPATSAKLVNPFVEFAIKNPDTASTREVIGFRSSAEKIYGLMTAGTDNLNYASNDGIQSLSGFMRIAGTSGSVDTKQTLFGKTQDQILGGNQGRTGNPRNLNVNIFGIINDDTIFTSDPANDANFGISVPALKNVAFTTPDFQVNGKRKTGAAIQGIKLKLANIQLGKIADGAGGFTSIGAKNQLFVKLNPSVALGIVKDSKFFAAEGSAVRNLNLSIDFIQSLSMIHNIPLNGTGGYLALQAQSILWPGSHIDNADAGKTDLNLMTKSDIAQSGWWMSFADPVQLGTLKSTDPVDISAALPQVAKAASNYLLDNPVMIGNEGVGALSGTPLGKVLDIDLEKYTNPNAVGGAVPGAAPIQVNLQNVQLANQTVISNCYGTLKFC